MTAITRPHALALALIRDEAVSIQQLAQHFADSEAFCAGLIDIVTSNQDWRVMFHVNEEMPTRAEQDDYARGAMTAELLLDAERYAEGWVDAYTLAAVEQQRAAEALPAADDDSPF